MGDIKQKILVVDDDVVYLRTVDSYLKTQYNVTIFKSSQMAVEYLMTETPDLVIVDYQMPFCNGANLMNIINNSNSEKPIPTILISGALDEEAVREICACKPRAYLTKPITKDILLETIDRALW